MAMNNQNVKIVDSAGTNRAKVGTGGDLAVSLTNPSAAAAGIFASLNPYGSLRVSPEPTVEFFDAFDGTGYPDQVRWALGGVVLPQAVNGSVSMAATVGASVTSSSVLFSQPTFTSPGLGFSVFGCTVTLEAAASATNVYRFWGKGTTTTDAYATPVTDGCGFEVDSSGALQCVIYAGGTKYVINSTVAANISSSVTGAGGSGAALPTGSTATNYGAPLTWRGSQHRYAMMIRSDVVYWFIEGQDVPVAAASYLVPQTQGLPIRLCAYTNPAATSTAYTYLVGAVSLSNSTANNFLVSDATYPFRKANVGAYGGVSVKGATTAARFQTFAAGATGAMAATAAGESGNVTFIVKNGAASVGYTGQPVIVFEQSDDGVQWAPLQVMGTTGSVVYLGTVTMPVGAANTEYMFDAALEGVSFVRARVITGTTTGTMTINVVTGSMPFSPTVGISGLPVLTKGAQGVSGVTVQDLKDSGRAAVTVASQAPSTAIVATAGTETALAVQYSKSQAAVVASNYTVAAGKTFRLQNITISAVQKGATAAVVGTVVNVRLASTTGPIIHSSTYYLPATANYVDRQQYDFPDGVELPAGTVIVVTTNSTVTTLAAVNFVLNGFEY